MKEGKMPRGQLEKVLPCLGFYSDPLLLLPQTTDSAEFLPAAQKGGAERDQQHIPS